MTDDLATALRTMAESEQPPVMDVERVLHRGRHSLMRRRMAALGGGTAVLAATGLAVGVLAPAGGLGHRGRAVSAAPATTTTVRATTPTTSSAAGPTTPASSTASGPTAQPGPSDLAVTHWQFGYLPQGMAAYGADNGDSGGGKGVNAGTVTAYDSSGFQLTVLGMSAPGGPGQYTGAPTTKVPATVAGASQAFWWGFADGRITIADGIQGSDAHYALLDWQLPGGQWLEMIAKNVDSRADWEGQTLTAAEHVIRQDRPIALPIRLTGVPQGYTFTGGWVTRDDGNTFSQLNFSVNPARLGDNSLQIVAFKRTGFMTAETAVPPQNDNSCADSNGLTVCVSAYKTESAGLAAVGGVQGVLRRVTSFGNDPANWTTDILR